jgi:cytochrome c-type biogenesis protein
MEGGAAGNLGILVAFAAGMLSFLSPCVLPLVPSYVTFITGMTLEDLQQTKRETLLHALTFVVGFSLIFLALGAGATVFGQLMLRYREWISRVGGVLIIVFGLYLLGVLNLGFLARDTRLHLKNKPLGYFGTLVVGIAFGAGWSPCIGPILGAILTMAANEADLQRGLLLLFAYSAGLAVPFLLAALMVDRFLALFAKVRTQMIWVNRFAGAMLILVGILMVTDRFTMMATWLQDLTPEWLRDRI